MCRYCLKNEFCTIYTWFHVESRMPVIFLLYAHEALLDMLDQRYLRRLKESIIQSTKIRGRDKFQKRQSNSCEFISIALKIMKYCECWTTLDANFFISDLIDLLWYWIISPVGRYQFWYIQPNSYILMNRQR